MAPVKALMGFDPVSPLVASLGRGGSEQGYASPKDAEDAHLRRLLEAWEVVRTFDHEAKQKQKVDYDKRHKVGVSYTLGDKVWLFTPSLGRSRKIVGLSRKLSSRWAGPYTVSRVHENKVNYKLRNVHGRELQQWVHIHRLKDYVSRPPPEGVPVELVNEPEAFDADDFDPSREPDFDFEFHSDRWEPSGPDDVSERLWGLWELNPRAYETPAVVPPTPAEERPVPDLFAPLAKAAPRATSSVGKSSSTEPAAAQAAPPSGAVAEALTPTLQKKAAKTPPIVAKAPEKRVESDDSAEVLPLPLREFKRELRDFDMQLHTIDLEKVKDEKHALREFRRTILLLLENFFGDVRKLKQQCNVATLREFRAIVNTWITNFDQVFADKIAAFRRKERQDK